MTRKWLTTTETAQALGISPTTVRKLIKEQQIRAGRIGKWWRISTAELDRVMREGVREVNRA